MFERPIAPGDRERGARWIDPSGRLTHLLSMIIGTLLMVSSLYTLTLTGFSPLAISLASSGVLFFVVDAVGRRAKMRGVCAAANSIILLAVVMPSLFLEAQSIDGSLPLWMLASMLYMWVADRGMVRAFSISAAICETAVAYGSLAARAPQDGGGSPLAVLLSLLALFAVFVFFIRAATRMILNDRIELEAQKAEIEHLVAAESVFFSKMSHEIRTPINAIIGFNELTLRTDAPASVLDNATAIRRASRMLLSLINDIIDVSKIRSGGMELVPYEYRTAEMLLDAIEVDRLAAEAKGLDFSVSIDGAVPDVMYGDGARLRQVLVNLLSNAIKYTRSGSVSLTVRCKELEGDLVRLMFDVADTGIGIKREDMADLFSVFGRADRVSNREVEGSGLGLSIVKNIVELMEGEVTVDSVYTRGSTFRVAVPQRRIGSGTLSAGDLDRSGLSVAPRASGADVSKGRRVLVVDDNEMNLRVARDLLVRSGFAVDTADSGAACLARTSERAYDVILMDHFMPGMDGAETLLKIRSQEGGMDRSVPVIALTANADKGADHYLRMGFDGFLAKPVMPDVMERAIESVLPGRSAMTEGERASAPRQMTGRRKRKMMITVESTADISPEMRETVGISEIPVHVLLSDGRSFLDGVEISSHSLASIAASSDVTARTSGPSVEEYEAFFADRLMEAEHVIHISLPEGDPGRESVTAAEAASIFGSIDVVSAGSVSTGHGLLAYLAARRALEGADRADLLEYIERMRGEISFDFFIGDPARLAASRRLSPAASSLCKALMLHPTASYRRGKLALGHIEIGSDSGTRLKFIDRVLRRRDGDGGTIYVTHTDIEPRELGVMLDTISSQSRFKDVKVVKSSAGIFANSGAGSLALTYLRADRGGGSDV